MALRALVAAHAQSAWNRSTRQLTRVGRNFALVFIVIGWLFGAGGFGLGMLALGWAAGREIEGRGLPLAGGTIVLLSWGIGLLFGITGGGRLLEVGQLKSYPVRPLTTFFAELVARLADPLTFGVSTGLFCFCAGIAVSAPSRVPVLLFLFPVHLFILIAMQFFCGEVLAAVARRARIALVLVFVLAMGFSPRVIAWLESGGDTRLHRLDRLIALAGWLPGSRLLAGPRDVADALLLGVQTLAGPLLLIAAGVWVMGREQSAHAAVATDREEGLWTFDAPHLGIARLHLATLFRTPVGRFALIAPLFAMVMVPWVTQMLFGWQRASLAVFMYAALGTVQFHFNMFGFDGPSVGELFRLPLSGRTLVLGKHLAVLSIALLEGAVLAVFLRLVRGEALDECIAGLCAFLAINLFMAGVGRFVSVLWPRTLPRSGMRGSSPPLPVILVNLFGTASIAGSIAVTHWVVQNEAPAWLVPWGISIVAAGALLFQVTLQPGADFLDARREKVLLAMK